MSDFGGRLIETIREVAKEFPNQVNKACQYVDFDTHEGCIVGEALFRMGIIKKDPNDDRYREVPAHDINNGKFVIVGIELIGKANWDEMTQEELKWVDVVQEYQDKKIPWGDAVKKADRYCSL
ncbi:hypothetical protein SEA_LABELLE_59 [Mycobacterium phage Labelle]|nr:hypothetical protein SEA_LABELLE_59 [Mycobacterium phage Labelle]